MWYMASMYPSNLSKCKLSIKESEFYVSKIHGANYESQCIYLESREKVIDIWGEI